MQPSIEDLSEHADKILALRTHLSESLGGDEDEYLKLALMAGLKDMAVKAEREVIFAQAGVAAEGSGGVCGCCAWKQNIDKINGPIEFMAVTGRSSGYDGDRFNYCPWCGRALLAVQIDGAGVRE